MFCKQKEIHLQFLVYLCVSESLVLFMSFTFCESVFLQASGVNDLSPSGIPLMDDADERSSNHTDAQVKNTTNDSSSNHMEIEPEAASEI